MRLRHTVTIEQLRHCLRGAAERIRFEGHRVLVMHKGRPWIALVPVQDLEQLERAEQLAGATGDDPRNA